MNSKKVKRLRRMAEAAGRPTHGAGWRAAKRVFDAGGDFDAAASAGGEATFYANVRRMTPEQATKSIAMLQEQAPDRVPEFRGLLKRMGKCQD